MTTEENNRRMDGGKGILAKACAVIVALAAIGFISLMSLDWFFQATSEDHERVNDFALRLKQDYPFSVQRSDGKGPAVYCVPNSWTDFISIYGDYRPEEVTEIEAAARSIQAERSVKKKVKLSFYKREKDEGSLYREVMIR